MVQDTQDAQSTTSHNGFYHEVKAKGLVREESLRQELRRVTSPKVGVVAQILLDYRCELDSPDAPRRYAYGATLVFSHLSDREYQKLTSRLVSRHGRNSVAESAAVKELLDRDDIVSIFYDEGVMAHPVIARQIKSFEHLPYGNDGSHVSGATPEAIQRLLTGGPLWGQVPVPPAGADRHPGWLAVYQAESIRQAPDDGICPGDCTP